MPKLKSLVEFMKVFLSMAKSDWLDMDHRLFRIAATAASFLFWALLWYFFFRNTTPF